MRGATPKRQQGELWHFEAPGFPSIELKRATGRLLPHVDSYYLFRSDQPEFTGMERIDIGQIRFMTRGEGDMIFPDGHVEKLRPIMVAGPGTAAATYRLRGPVEVFGVVLRAMGWKALIGLPAHKFTDHIIDGSKLFCERAPELLERMHGMTTLDEMISGIAPLLIMRQEEVKPVPEPHYPFLLAVREWAASEDPSIDTLYARIQETSGLGERQVQRLCLEYFGGPPTKLKRKFRATRAAMQLYRGVPLDDVLMPFADQSHMINEVKHFTGHTPTTLRNSNDTTLAMTLDNENFHLLPGVIPEPV
ncbi:MAG TPA: helix-turn-helix domain-containing protein, partial [Sphingomonas sp.]|nr:helix-turn-helix domain-containing protein [Sphingomonas sp.]